MSLAGRHDQRPGRAPARTGGAALHALGIAPAGLGLGACRVQPQAVRRLCRLAAVAALAWAGTAFAAPPAGTAITNTATARFTVDGSPVSVSGSATVFAVGTATPATLALLAYAPDGAQITEQVGVTSCRAGTDFTPLPPPRPPGQPVLAVPGTHGLSPTQVYAAGDVVFIKLQDAGRNQDPGQAEAIELTVSSAQGDTEALRLTESGPSTGVFVGYLPTSSGVAAPGNCVLDTGRGQTLSARYTSPWDPGRVLTAAARVDPVGRVFDARTGQPVDGVEVTLIDMATQLPARVVGEDGVSAYPSTVRSGSTVTDASGRRYLLGPGQYQFPRLAAGRYRLALTPPAGHAFPSTAAADALQALPNAPFALVTGSHGEPFELPGGPLREIDLPLDPAEAPRIALTKSAGKAVTAIGEFVPYTLTLRHTGKSPVAGVRIADRLPPGFRYQGGSARLNGQPLADPIVGADGRSLEFAVGTLPGNDSSGLTLRYVAAVLARTPSGPAENTAVAVGGVSSNVARASVLVRDDLNRERSILTGRVTQVARCEAEGGAAPEPVPLKDVRVMLQDGSYVVTDAQGRWHADHLRPGTHVVQLDETSLPPESEYRSCESPTRTGGRDFSQLVNLRPGTLWRADMRLVQVPSCLRQQIRRQGRSVQLALAAPIARERVSATVLLPGARVVPGSVTLDGRSFPQAELGDGFLVLRLARHPARWRHTLAFTLDRETAEPTTLAVQLQPNRQPVQSLRPLSLPGANGQAEQCAPIALPTDGPAPAAPVAHAAAEDAGARQQLIEQLPYDDKWIAAAAPGVEWLHPRPDFQPALPVVKVAVKHGARDRLALRVNGEPVDPLRYDGMLTNPAGTLGLSSWRSLPLRSGANTLELTVHDAEGQLLLQQRREIHYVVGPAKGVLEPGRSTLVADGRFPPVIAVRLLDKDDKPVRRGATGELQISAPYQSFQPTPVLQGDPLSGPLGGKPRYEVGEDGIALIRLQPTTQAGEVVLNFDFGNGRQQALRVWLTPELREWVLVGFAEGTLGHKQLSGNMEALRAAGADDQLFDRDRLAFYAKGQVRGDYLLTLAYDSAKEKHSGGSQVLRQAVNPTQYYTLYADATQPQFDAASAGKLYLKIEKSQFYALFGDYDTGLTLTELGRYSRTLNGAKAEYQGERLGYTAFASETTLSYRRDEIAGQGVSGLYRLSSGDLVVNTDKVRIETRDRLRPEIVLRTQELTRYLDYQIDPVAGTLFFREPVPTFDAALNPVFIVAEYEADSRAGASLSYGGRASVKLGDQGSAGLTHLHEGNTGREATLTAADATLLLDEHTRLRAELAQSERRVAQGPESGQAYLVELAHNDKSVSVRAYARQQDPGFGLGQQSGLLTGTRKLGGDAQLKLSDSTQLQGLVVREEKAVLGAWAERQLAEGRLQWSENELSSYVGARVGSESDSAGLDHDVHQLLGGVSYQLMERRLTLRAAAELDASGSVGQLPAEGQPPGGVSLPSRVVLGADYRLTAQTSLVAAHELAWADPLKVSLSHVGLRTQAWTGAELAATVGSESGEDAERLYSNLGLVQKLQLNERWAADFGLSRVQTLRGSAPAALAVLNPANRMAADKENGVDYNAAFLGAAYRDPLWSGNGRVEWRRSALSDKVNLLMAARRSLDVGRAVAAGLLYHTVDAKASSEADSRRLNLRLSYADRPLQGEWMWLDRLDVIHESQQTPGSTLRTRKLVNNLNANWQPNHRGQLALQYSAKYVLDTLDQAAYRGFTDLVGLELRRDLGARWDAGLHASVLRAWQSGSREVHAGVSTAVLLAQNVWLALGYNQRGFSDPDFAGARYRAKGFYLSLRMKFDQDSFDLNQRRQGVFSLSASP